MGHPLRQVVFDRVLVDLNTQCDFLLSKGAAPVANRLTVLPNVRRVMNWARLPRRPVQRTIVIQAANVSTVAAVRWEVCPAFEVSNGCEAATADNISPGEIIA